MIRSRSRLRRPAILVLAASVLLGVAAAALTHSQRAAAVPRKVTHLEPDALDILRSPRKFLRSTRRHVILRPDRLDLMAGPALVTALPFPGAGGSSLADVAGALARTPQAGWIEETAPGVFLLRVSLVQAPGSVLKVAAPAVRQIRLLDDPEVYLSAMGATARFIGVTVTSWNPRRGRPATNRGQRPFVLYADGSDLRIVRSTFAHLGSDRASAYGVNWRRSTGGATGSVFHHNFFGAYTYQSHRLVFRGNVFRDNQVYGLDPHTGSTRLVIEANRAYRNRSHGIVVSEDVTDGVARGNRSYANGGNGIVLDERSDRNTVTGNQAEGNRGDGIVILGSSGNLVGGNDVRRNRVGIRVNLRSGDNRIQRNQVAGNRIGIELYGGAYHVRLLANVVSGSAEKGVVLEARARPAATTGSRGRRSGSRSGPRPGSGGPRWPRRARGSSSPNGASPLSTAPPCAPPPPASRSARAAWSGSGPPPSTRPRPWPARRRGPCWATGSPCPAARSPGWPWPGSPTWWWPSSSSCCR